MPQQNLQMQTFHIQISNTTKIQNIKKINNQKIIKSKQSKHLDPLVQLWDQSQSKILKLAIKFIVGVVVGKVQNSLFVMEAIKEHHSNHLNLLYNKKLHILNYVDANQLQISLFVMDNLVNAQKHSDQQIHLKQKTTKFLILKTDNFIIVLLIEFIKMNFFSIKSQNSQIQFFVSNNQIQSNLYENHIIVNNKLIFQNSRNNKLISFLQISKFFVQITHTQMEDKKQMEERKPDPRFIQFEQQFDADGTAIGFKIPGKDFLYQYDSYGGWTDENGKIFDKDGYLIEQEFIDQSQESAEDSQVDDDQIIDQFQQMLIEQEEGIIHKPKPQKKVQEPVPPADYKQIDFEVQAKKYIQKLKNKQQIRQGVSPLVWIFFKMRSSLYQRIVPQVQKKQSQTDKNELVKKIKAKIQQKRKQLLSNNAWLQGQFTLQYSGTSLDDNAYDRYWYGWIKVSHQNYGQTLQRIKKSSQFALLKSKTFYALKSKFYLKNKMKETIQALKKPLQAVNENNAVLIKLNNLPEQFPLSFVLDLLQLNGGNLQDIQDINIVDDFSADLIVKKKTALILTNIQGYCHDQKQFIWIEIQDLNRPFKFNEFFNIQINAPYKVAYRQVCDTLALQNSKQQLAKFCDKEQKFRLVANQAVLRKLLMFRGESLNIERVVRFQRIQKKQ